MNVLGYIPFRMSISKDKKSVIAFVTNFDVDSFKSPPYLFMFSFYTFDNLHI